MQNFGAANANLATMTNVLPEGVTLISASGKPSVEEGKLVWSVPKVRKGGKVTRKVKVQAHGAGSISNYIV